MRHRHRAITRRSITALAALAALLSLPAGAAAAPSITLLDPAQVASGTPVVATGTIDPVVAGELVQLEQQLDGAWTKVGQLASTDAAGAWRVTFTPRTGGQVRAVQLSGAGGTSAETTVAVLPALSSSAVQSSRIYPFLGASATWRIAAPGYPGGRAWVELRLDRKNLGRVRAQLKDGLVKVKLPTNGIGRYDARLVLPARGGFGQARYAPLRFTVRGERVGSGSSRSWNRSLRAALRFRGFHVPGGSTFDSRMGESVIAFHKAYGRSRTTTFEASDWSRLSRRKVQVRDRSDGLHIEIDKARQILMQVRDGRPTMIIHVSTGSTGNTPAGRHSILWKGNWVPSLYGSLLYKSMAFRGAFAIHGYPSVPTTPASHGCVRVPMWIAATLYRRSPVGTPVIIYEGPGSTTVSVGRTPASTDVPELTGVDPDRWADER
jgi:hypothetical protein